MSKAIVLLSGGIDSATCMGMACQNHETVVPIHINYGQQTAELERQMAYNQCVNMAKQYPNTVIPRTRVIDYRDVMGHFSGGVASDRDSFETDDGELVEDDGRSTGYQPMRNLHLIATAAGIADIRDADALYHGAQGGDEADYPDCRPEFMHYAEMAVNKSLADGEEIDVKAPLIHLSKEEVIQAGDRVGVDFSATYSCYSSVDSISNPNPCGNCPACEERSEAFREAGVEDPYGI